MMQAKPERDTRIDVLRALALLTIYIDHVPGTLFEHWTYKNFGFSDAAEGFVHEIPAGRLDDGEKPIECAARELREETGYSAKKLIPLTTFYTTPGFTDERIHLFAAIGLSEGNSELESDEILDLVQVPISKALEMIQTGELVDGKSMVGLFFASRFLSRG